MDYVKLGGMQRLLLLVFVLSLVGCHQPLAPSPERTLITARLELRVVGHVTNQPLAGLSAQLLGFGGGATQTTDIDGLVSWRVPVRTPYTIVVDGGELISGYVDADARWLLSLPR